MFKALKITFLIHAVVAALVGAPLLIIPGRFLQLVGWQAMLQAIGCESTDPMISRVLGAALLALAWSSFRGWRATERAQVTILVEMEVFFTVLGCVGLGRHLVERFIAWGRLPGIGVLAFAVLAVFAIAWIVFLFASMRKK